MKEKTLKSGAVLRLQIAAFEESMALLEAILREAVGVKIDGLEGLELKDLAGRDIMQMKDLLFKVIASKAVKEALWVCMSSCTYQAPGDTAGIRIERATFQSEKTRGDYFPVAGEVTVFNLAPFFANLELPSSLLAPPEAGGESSPAPSTG